MRRKLAGGFELDDDPARVDLDAVHAFISERSYWGRGRSRDLQERAIRGSTRVVGLYLDGRQVGFARAVCDEATVAYLADVYSGYPHEGHFPKYALFVTYFPHLVAGPILHHREMMPQFGSEASRWFSHGSIVWPAVAMNESPKKR